MGNGRKSDSENGGIGLAISCFEGWTKGKVLMACKVKVNRHGYLAFRLYWNGNESWEGTDWKDTPKNRERAEARAVLMSEEIKDRTFDYLKWFPDGNRAHLFKPNNEAENKDKMVGEFYRDWIERRKPPFVRPGLPHDYTRQFGRYILPKFENTRIVDITLPVLEALRSHLNGEMGLSLKSCRNIIDGTFRAMMRFANLEWARIISPKSPKAMMIALNYHR
jgi:hypothetical protein